MPEPHPLAPRRTQGLVDVLDRILDKGLVIAGDIRVRLADVELLTIQIRLLVCSVDKAEEIGLDWWRTDPRLSTAGLEKTRSGLTPDRLEALEARIAALERPAVPDSDPGDAGRPRVRPSDPPHSSDDE